MVYTPILASQYGVYPPPSPCVPAPDHPTVTFFKRDVRTSSRNINPGRCFPQGKVPLSPQEIPLLPEETSPLWPTIPPQKAPSHKES